jgi:hypothetical protein
MTVRALAESMNPDIVYVDASYLLLPEKKRFGQNSRREQVSDVIGDLRKTSLALDRPFIQSVQFNREAKRDRVRAPGQSGEQQEERRSPIAHLSLEKIAETDVIGQASVIVIGIEKYNAPFEDVRRWMGFLKGREGETGYWGVNYSFNPVDFSIIRPEATGDDEELPEANLNWMA